MTKIGQKLIRILGAFSLDIPLRGLSGVLSGVGVSGCSGNTLGVAVLAVWKRRGRKLTTTNSSALNTSPPDLDTQNGEPFFSVKSLLGPFQMFSWP